MDAEIDDGKKFTFKIIEEDQKVFEQSVERTLESGADLWECSYRFKHKEGRILSILDRGYVLRADKGKAVRLIGAMHDDTIRKEYESRIVAEELRSMCSIWVQSNAAVWL